MRQKRGGGGWGGVRQGLQFGDGGVGGGGGGREREKERQTVI